MTDTLTNHHPAIKEYWAIHTAKGAPKSDRKSWHEQLYQLSKRGVSFDEALLYLKTTRPTYEAFLQWIEDNHEFNEVTAVEEDVLTKEDLASWEENGYVILKNAVPKEQCGAGRAAIWDYLEASPEKPESWYTLNSGKRGMMLALFQHPALNAIRESGRIKKAYQQLYGNEPIFLFIDKVSFNPPINKYYKFEGSNLHWDVSLHQPIPFALQGLLYLNDTGADDGAFHCVPGFHKKIGDWLKSLPKGADPRAIAPEELKPTPIAANAGDLIIWHQALPHCATPNKGNTPRMVQYISYQPVESKAAEVWI